MQNYFQEYNKRCSPNFKRNAKTGCSTYECLPNYPWNNVHASSKTTWGCSQKILNDKDIMRAIEYVTRYCYATRSAPFNTMHGACCDYGINWKQYLNSCEGDDEAIPVTVLLVSMYNACYTFQDDQRENLLILTLRGLDHGSRGTIPDKAFIRTFSEYTQHFHITLLIRQII